MIRYIQENYPNGLKGAEIGTYKGLNAESMMDTLDINRLYLIDSYSRYEGYNDPFIFLKDSTLERACTRLIPWEDRLTWVVKKSDIAVYDIPSSLDFVYIDGNHDYEYVLGDIELYYPKVRDGGVIGGHDIYLKGVREAVETCFDYYYEEFPDWWVVKTG